MDCDTYRFLEAGLNMIIRCIPNITLIVGIAVYKQTGKETGQVQDLVPFRENAPFPRTKLNK